MATTDIAIRYQFLKKQLDAAQHKIDALRARCPHTEAKKVPKASTGNYDPSDDRYWYNCSCPWCGQYWTEDQ